MSYYDEDFYHEPSEFDILVEQFKESLMNSVKEKYVSEMEQLRKENGELQEVKANFESIKRDFENKKFELESERSNLQSKIRRERLVDLLEDHKIIMYRVTSKHEMQSKCDKCDDRRRIHYLSPQGKKQSENCLCSEGKNVYYPNEYLRYEFRLKRDSKILAWYRQYSDNDDGLVSDHSITADYIYSPEMMFEDLSKYSTFFKTEEECQKYCDYLNSKEVK